MRNDGAFETVQRKCLVRIWLRSEMGLPCVGSIFLAGDMLGRRLRNYFKLRKPRKDHYLVWASENTKYQKQDLAPRQLSGYRIERAPCLLHGQLHLFISVAVQRANGSARLTKSKKEAARLPRRWACKVSDLAPPSCFDFLGSGSATRATSHA